MIDWCWLHLVNWLVSLASRCKERSANLSSDWRILQRVSSPKKQHDHCSTWFEVFWWVIFIIKKKRVRLCRLWLWIVTNKLHQAESRQSIILLIRREDIASWQSFLLHTARLFLGEMLLIVSWKHVKADTSFCKTARRIVSVNLTLRCQTVHVTDKCCWRINWRLFLQRQWCLWW